MVTRNNHTHGCGSLPLRTIPERYAIVRMPDRHNDEDWALRLLTEQDVLIHPGFLFDFAEDHCLVCSLLTPQSEFAAGVARLMDLIAAD